MKTTILSHKKSITRSAIFAILCFAILCFININSASALTYQSSHEIGFEFNPTVSITLSGDLVINNLAPGSTSDSNTIDITVATNNVTGYTLLATAGTNSTNTNLVNTANSSYKFTSIATNANLASLTTDNTWGFSYSSNNGSTWSNYSGLPLDNNDEGATGKQLARTTSMSGSTPIKFKIGAKASQSQASGTYTNVINFYAVVNVIATNYTISYIDESGEATNMPSTQTGTTNNIYVWLRENEPERDGYSFIGWCDEYTTDENCAGTIWNAGGVYGIANPGGTISVNLYAMWDEVYSSGPYTVTINNSSDLIITGGDGEYYENDEVYLEFDEPSFSLGDFYCDAADVVVESVSGAYGEIANMTLHESEGMSFTMPADDVIVTATLSAESCTGDPEQL